MVAAHPVNALEEPVSGGPVAPPMLGMWRPGPPISFLKVTASSTIMVLPHVLADGEACQVNFEDIYIYMESCHRCTFLMIAMFVHPAKFRPLFSSV